MAQQEDRHGDPQFEKRNRSPWLMMALIFGGLILMGILWMRPGRPLQSAPAGDTEVSVQPSADQVGFENIQVVPSPAPEGAGANNVVIQADLRNFSDARIAAVVVEGVFMDKNGEAIYRQKQPVMAVEKEAGEAKEMPLNEQQIPRRGMQAVRITFSAVPPEWNKKDPQLNVQEVRMQPLTKEAEKQ